jgi:hypothetical protein
MSRERFIIRLAVCLVWAAVTVWFGFRKGL